MVYNNNTRYEDEDENGYQEDEEEGKEYADGGEEGYNERPMSTDVDNDELHDGGTTMMKIFMAQMFNEHRGDDEDDIHHSQIETEEVDRHDDDEWRIQRLSTADDLGNPYTLEALMDTGATQNFMSEEAVLAHGIEYAPMQGPEMPAVKTGAGEMQPEGIVTLRYRAGISQSMYEEEFLVKDGIPHDVILGLPFLQHSHAITINPDFAMPPDDEGNTSEELCVFETTPATKESREAHAAFRAQKLAERQAAYKVRTGR